VYFRCIKMTVIKLMMAKILTNKEYLNYFETLMLTKTLYLLYLSLFSCISMKKPGVFSISDVSLVLVFVLSTLSRN